MTIRKILSDAALSLKRVAADRALFEARLLLGHVLKMDSAVLVARDDESIAAGDYQKFSDILNRRIQSEPVAYIIGFKEFYGLKYYVNKSVLIPRPETEGLVEIVLRSIADRNLRSGTIVDLGTGSGCIALSLAKHLDPTFQIIGIDISSGALGLAQKNAEELNLRDRVTWINKDFTEADHFLNLMDITAVISNPPYIPSLAIDSLTEDIRRFEPKIALDGGLDGISFYRSIFQIWYEKIHAGGLMAVETYGKDQIDHLKTLAPIAGDMASGSCRVWDDGPHLIVEKT